MTKAQKAALRHAYALVQSRYQSNNQPTENTEDALHGWIVPDTEPTLDYLNEAVCAALVVRGHMECHLFQSEKLWRYRITPEGCAAIGKHYPGVTSPIELKQERIARQHERHIDPNFRQNQQDIHRFRRSSDWRRC